MSWYALYSLCPLRQSKTAYSGAIPSELTHLAIIPDGNRRWAKQRLLQPWKGHKEGMAGSRKLLEWCVKHPTITTLTFWGFSSENWQREASETSFLMKIFEQFLQDERMTFRRNKVRLVHSGRLDRIPQSLQKLLQEVIKETATDFRFTLNLALDYGGHDEIIRAIHKVAEPATVTAEEFQHYLDQPSLPAIDAVIRTSGEARLSGFASWQAAYAELIFVDKLYPDFTPEDLAAAVAEYEGRQRRFGK